MEQTTKNWLALAQNDYQDSLYLFKGARYPNAVYLPCQAIEKGLKAAQTAVAETTPKKIHNLVTLAEECGLSFSKERLSQLGELNRHYRRIRYRDIAQTHYNTKAKTEPIIQEGKTLYQWIRKQLTNH